MLEGFAGIARGELGDFRKYCGELPPNLLPSGAEFNGPLDQGADLADLSTRVGHTADCTTSKAFA
jgi:hypothetical protein